MTPTDEDRRSVPRRSAIARRRKSLAGRRPAVRRAGRCGATVVETALVLNVCLMFMLALFDFSRVIMLQQLVTNAAREGCRYAVVNTETATTSQVQAVVTSYLAGQQISSLVISVYEANPTTGANIGAWTDAALTDSIGVQVTGKIATITPTFSLLPSTINLSATSVMASEGN